MTVAYFPWCDDNYDDSLAWIDTEPEEMSNNGWRLKQGEPCRAWFPPSLVFNLSRRYGIRVSDAVPNTLALLVVSEKLRELLEKLAPESRIEFLPVQIRNQKSKMIDKKYFVANVLDVVPCTDMKNSDYTMGAVIKTQVQRFRRLVLDERRIPKDKKIFRLGERTQLVIARHDLAQAIVDADCGGMLFIDMEDYGKEFR